MTPEYALARIKALVAAGAVVAEGDTNWALGARCLAPADVAHARAAAVRCVATGSRWRVLGGVTPDGEALTFEVRIDLAGCVNVLGIGDGGNDG